MSAWARVPPGVTVRCGGCRTAIPAGAPVYRVTLAGVRRARVRCAACAGPAPPDLPARPVVAPPEPVTWTPVARVAAFDWRARAAGMAGREPGEDDA